MRGHGDRSSDASPLDADTDFFEGLVEAAGEAVLTVDADGTVVYANAAVEDLLGYDPADLRGEPFTAFVPDRYRDRYEGWLRRFAAGDAGTPLDDPFEVTWLTRDGEEIRLAVSVFAHESDGRRRVSGFLREPLERTEAREQLREEEALVEEIFDTSPIAISVRDADGDLLRANDRAAELVGLDPADVSEAAANGTTDDEWSLYDADGEPIPEEDRPVERVLRTGSPVYNEEIVLERPEGDRVHMSVNAAPVYKDGKLRRVVTAAEDVTELKRSQHELERRREELETELSEVFSRIADAFFALNDDWEFTYVNDEAEALLDRREEDLVGETIWDEFPEAVDTRFEREYRRAMEIQEPVSFVDRYPPLSAWFEVRAYPSETGLSVYFRDVSERREREQQLERYETIVETVEDGIYVVGPDGTFSMVNSSFADLVGYEVEELVGTRPSILYDEETKAEARRLQREIIDGERSSATVEHPLRTADGDSFPAETTFVVRRTAGGDHERVGVTRDITERKRFEQTLTALHESSRELLGLNTGDAVAESVVRTVTDVLGIPGAGIYLWDEEAEELAPVAVSDHVEEIFGDLPAFEPGDESITWRTFADGETVTLADVTGTDLAYRDDTSLRSGIWIPLGDHGVLAVVSEETDAFGPDEQELADLLAASAEAALDRVERERERRRHERELEAQNERLDAFASMLAHELRNPLEIAQIYLDMGAGSVELDREAGRAFREVEQALDRIEEMIETLLIVTRRGGTVDTTEVVALDDAAVEWWDDMDLDATLAVETDREIRADASRLRQLLENLFRNAEEHAGPGATVRIGDLDDGFYVADDGPGIPADERETVFDPGHSTSNVGIGFGLAVVQQLVEAHDWRCEITESDEGGARFEFTGVEIVEE